jgi:uncharacterized protein YggT (Ycf19 family)
MTDWIIIILLFAIWFQGTKYSTAWSSDIHVLVHKLTRKLREVKHGKSKG